MLCFQKAPSSPGGAFALRGRHAGELVWWAGLFSEVAPHGGNRRPDLLDRGV
jgi:hypothetical protein